MVFTSSASVYRSPAPTYPTPESAPLEGGDTYTASKIEAERALADAARRGVISAVVLRLYTVYGPGPAAAAKGHLVARWANDALRGKPLVVHGNGGNTVDLVHVDDVVRATLAALDVDSRFCIVNVGSGTETKLLELAEWMRAVVPGLEVVRLPSREGRRRQFADIRLARRFLGWQPAVPPRDGITTLIRERLRTSARAREPA